MKKRFLKIAGIFLFILAAFVFAEFRNMHNRISSQTNDDIHMAEIKDGVYNGFSDGGLVRAEVQVP